MTGILFPANISLRLTLTSSFAFFTYFTWFSMICKIFFGEGIIIIIIIIIIMPHTCFRVNQHSIVVWMSRNALLETGAISEVNWLQRNLNPQQLSS